MKPCTILFFVKSNLKENPIVENLILKQFEVKLDSERIAFVTYEKVDENTYDLVHSSVPEEYQGMGLGHILAERVLDELVQRNKKIKLTCEFLIKFYEENHVKYSAYVLN